MYLIRASDTKMIENVKCKKNPNIYQIEMVTELMWIQWRIQGGWFPKSLNPLRNQFLDTPLYGLKHDRMKRESHG